MKRIILILTIYLLGFHFINAQKLDKPKHLGDWIAGEDPSEFLLHTVMEQTERLLKDNQDGKLIVRICSPFDFYTSFVRTNLNPLAASNYNNYRLIVPNEKIFVAVSHKCSSRETEIDSMPVFVFNQFWFVPEKSSIEYKEIYSVNDISYNKFEDINKYIKYLTDNPDTFAIITYKSNRRKLTDKVSEIEGLLIKNDIRPHRFKSVLKSIYEINEKGYLKPTEDLKQIFPELVTIEISKK